MIFNLQTQPSVGNNTPLLTSVTNKNALNYIVWRKPNVFFGLNFLVFKIGVAVLVPIRL